MQDNIRVHRKSNMGIQLLNSYIKRVSSSSSIMKIPFSNLANKVVVIDISIYLYRFLAEGELLEHIYLMLSLIKHHKIIPLFVFDGKAPLEKQKLLDKRHKDKLAAEKEYKELEKQCVEMDDTESKTEMQDYMYNLKRKFIRLKKQDIINVQRLITAFGAEYIEAEGEADVLCAKLVIKRYAYACLSEDMDLFVYGCPRVLRYLSLTNETTVIYHLDKILDDLNLSLTEFKEICVLSGTDYNYSAGCHMNLYKALSYFQQYKATKLKSNIDFYSWLDETQTCIKNIYDLYNIFNMFRTDSINLNGFRGTWGSQTNMDISKIKEIMEPVGFIFVD